jgi:hypothetical protein
MDWQPIETAPKDGRGILLFADGEVWLGRWGYSEPSGSYAEEKEWVTPSEGPGYNSQIENPTHWMPLPTPPVPD